MSREPTPPSLETCNQKEQQLVSEPHVEPAVRTEIWIARKANYPPSTTTTCASSDVGTAASVGAGNSSPVTFSSPLQHLAAETSSAVVILVDQQSCSSSHTNAKVPLSTSPSSPMISEKSTTEITAAHNESGEDGRVKCILKSDFDRSASPDGKRPVLDNEHINPGGSPDNLLSICTAETTATTATLAGAPSSSLSFDQQSSVAPIVDAVIPTDIGRNGSMSDSAAAPPEPAAPSTSQFSCTLGAQTGGVSSSTALQQHPEHFHHQDSSMQKDARRSVREFISN